MSLTDEDQRQIAQFMLIADHYLSLASPAAAVERTETLGMTKRSFMPRTMLTEETGTLAIVGAHISSAAIRLASIEAVLADADAATLSYQRCRAYFSGRESFNGREWKDGFHDDQLDRTCAEWFHVMLRDNAAHEEPRRLRSEPKPEEERKYKRRQVRQHLIEKTRFADAYAMVQAIATNLRALLEEKHKLVLPPRRP